LYPTLAAALTLVRRTRHAHCFGRWPNVGFKNPAYADDAAELLLFCKVIFLDWYKTVPVYLFAYK
jgi:hypothetical protein